MILKTFIEPVAQGFLLMTNILSVRIDNLLVPEIIASDCSSASLECVYSGAADDVIVQWLFNGSQVYEWSEGKEPTVSGLLAGRLDLSHRTPILHPVQRQTLRVLQLTPELSGDYTCVVQSRGQRAMQTKAMTVFSPEHEFELTVTSLKPEGLGIKCIAKHLYPQPDLIIECNRMAIAQQQRIWRNGSFYDAECTAVISAEYFSNVEVACRLQIPLVDYTVITKKNVSMGKATSGSSAVFSRLKLQSIIGLTSIISRMSRFQTI